MNFKKLTILIDLDDTMESLVAAWVEWLDKSHCLSVKPEDVVQWEMRVAFPSLSRDELYEPLNHPEFWETVKPKDDAALYIRKLMDDGHDVYICTTSHYKEVLNKIELVLFRHFPFIRWRQVIITSKKQLIKADVLVDDGYHNLIGGDYAKLLMDAPHNRSFNEREHGILRVHTWCEIYEIISEMAGKF